MGVNRKLVLDLFKTASPSQIHLLSSDEAKNTGLVTDFVTAVDLMPLSLCKASPPASHCVDNTQSAAIKPKP